jgi:hypothetical protein
VRAHCSAASVITARARSELSRSGDAPAREHRLHALNAEFAGLLENQVETILLEQRGA